MQCVSESSVTALSPQILASSSSLVTRLPLRSLTTIAALLADYAASHDDWRQYTLDNRRWRMEIVAQILAGLDDPNFVEGDGTLLDNSLLLMTSEFSNGSQHKSWNMPVLLAGSAGGVIQTGRFISYNDEAAGNPNTLAYSSQESNHNLFTSVLQAFGEADGHFGDDKAAHEGPLPGRAHGPHGEVGGVGAVLHRDRPAHGLAP